jgi:hypothetical protein
MDEVQYLTFRQDSYLRTLLPNMYPAKFVYFDIDDLSRRALGGT